LSINDRNIHAVTILSAKDSLAFFQNLELTEREEQIARRVVKEIVERLRFLVDVGLDYLTLERATATLSGGEAQRIRLATQIGAGLMGVLYILDEPSIGLHQRDNARLIATMERLRDLGNTVIVGSMTKRRFAPRTSWWTWGRVRASTAVRSCASALPRPSWHARTR
jgi:excinuclease ABC subunit A